jgi:hypothetical protein
LKAEIRGRSQGVMRATFVIDKRASSGMSCTALQPRPRGEMLQLAALTSKGKLK